MLVATQTFIYRECSNQRSPGRCSNAGKELLIDDHVAHQHISTGCVAVEGVCHRVAVCHQHECCVTQAHGNPMGNKDMDVPLRFPGHSCVCLHCEPTMKMDSVGFRFITENDCRFVDFLRFTKLSRTFLGRFLDPFFDETSHMVNISTKTK